MLLDDALAAARHPSNSKTNVADNGKIEVASAGQLAACVMS
jgi:hypothetical protein